MSESTYIATPSDVTKSGKHDAWTIRRYRFLRPTLHHRRECCSSTIFSLSHAANALSCLSIPVKRTRPRPRSGNRSGVHQSHSLSTHSTIRTGAGTRRKMPRPMISGLNRWHHAARSMRDARRIRVSVRLGRRKGTIERDAGEVDLGRNVPYGRGRGAVAVTSTPCPLDRGCAGRRDQGRLVLSSTAFNRISCAVGWGTSPVLDWGENDMWLGEAHISCRAWRRFSIQSRSLLPSITPADVRTPGERRYPFHASEPTCRINPSLCLNGSAYEGVRIDGNEILDKDSNGICGVDCSGRPSVIHAWQRRMTMIERLIVKRRSWRQREVIPPCWGTSQECNSLLSDLTSRQ